MAHHTVHPWLRWAVEPLESLRLLSIPIILYFNWELLTPRLAGLFQPFVPSLAAYAPDGHLPNPFAPLFLLSHRVPESSSDDPRYAKGWFDLLFLVYYIVFFSCFRQTFAVKMGRALARYFGIKKPAKVDRYGEQFYTCVYFLISGLWGVRIMSQLPTWWYDTKYFWLDYPHWDMKPELKRYYLMQMAHWLQELMVLVLKLEKPRKDYAELVAHHLVTLWLVGWSYLINLTLIGNAVYISMDLPDTIFAFSKMLNYMQYDRAKVVSFLSFVFIWSYFRHYLNFVILWSVWSQYDLIPDFSKQWIWAEGVYLNWWMQYQVFAPLVLLQALNLFWYYLIMRVLYRTIVTNVTDDDRSDDEGDDDDHKKDE